MKRWVQPEEIGQWILFLDDPAAASLTGDTIELDGGVRIMTGKPCRLWALTSEKHREDVEWKQEPRQDSFLLGLLFVNQKTTR